jgi:hypothetical protein
MKHYSICFECENYSIGEVDSDLIAVCVCPKGHKTVMRIGSNLCDTLYSSAVNAYIKDCLSESVMSFAAALERSFEMFIKITLHCEGITFEEIDSFWKELSRQSERQYGAFCSQYLKTVKEPWKANQKMLEFRNKVVHKGYIASHKEVTEYAEYVTDMLYKILKHLHKNFENESMIHYFHEMNKSQKRLVELAKTHNAKVGTHSFSLLNWTIKGMPEVKFTEAVIKMKNIGRM